MKWTSPDGPHSQSAQLDPDQIPFVVIPTSTLGTDISDPDLARKLASEFRERTERNIGDWDVVIYGDKWVPAVIGDGGPFNKLGEASSQVFRLVGLDRCKKWSDDNKHCVGMETKIPTRTLAPPTWRPTSSTLTRP